MNLRQLQDKLNYQFNNEDLLMRALTHRSHGQSNNERLEFLGDSILNFTIASLLFEGLKKEDEGDLSRIRASLVNQQTLADLSTMLGLSEVLRLGEGELKSGGFRRPSILADALEAIFGAIYVDSDIQAAQTVIARLYKPLIANVDFKTAGKDNKTLLQEMLQAKRLALPKYVVVDTRGAAHDQEFVVECRIEDLNIVTEASGHSRRQAEQSAASLALEQVAPILSNSNFSKEKHKERQAMQLSLPVATEQEQSNDGN
ncbi:MAG: ribonuclease III [Alcaligenaceae bacterium]|nr:ribonuclease III [Alcaligenaceae bacterium]